MGLKTEFKQRVKDAIYRRSVLEAILFSSTTEDSFRLPTLKGFVLSELANATIEYVGGNAGQVDFQKFRYDRKAFERSLWKHYKSEMDKHSDGKLDSKIKEAIDKLIEHRVVSPDGPDRPYSTAGLYDTFRFESARQSSFSLPQEVLISVQKEILPSLSEPERKDIEEIGKLMRKYINKDLKFIGKTYHW